MDLDADQTKGTGIDGPNGPIDLFFPLYRAGVSPQLRPNGGELYLDQGNEKDAHARCKANIGLAEYERPFYATPGQQFCFRTSDGHTAWMRVNDVSNNSSNADYIVVNVKVWPSGMS